MGDPEQLRARLKGKAELILGDINDTIGAFTATLTPECPLGFVSIDVDIYSGTVAALKGLEGPAEVYLPAISFYLDDVGSYFNNDVCGELGAVNEHNLAHPLRPIDIDRSLPGRRADRTGDVASAHVRLPRSRPPDAHASLGSAAHSRFRIT